MLKTTYHGHWVVGTNTIACSINIAISVTNVSDHRNLNRSSIVLQLIIIITTQKVHIDYISSMPQFLDRWGPAQI
jgi:hypothetical protein